MTTQTRIIIGDSRFMTDFPNGTVDLVVTSPPYWQIKDYGAPGQIGHGQSLHEYLRDLYAVWRECFRVLKDGSRLCLNIGDQFARAAVYGRYKIIPLHAEFIQQCEHIGFDFMGAIIWQKKTTMNTTGGAPIMGSYPFPPNGLIEIDYEFIQIFKKPGPARKMPQPVKETARLTKAEWKEYFAGHWHFGGAHQTGHEAVFPAELPRRLIRMFTFPGDTVLDPFVGSGTTVKVARDLDRNAIGYELNPDFLPLLQEKIGIPLNSTMQVCRPDKKIEGALEIDYTPRIKNVGVPQAAGPPAQEQLPRVVKIIDAGTLGLDNHQKVQFLGVKIDQEAETRQYLEKMLLGKPVVIKNGHGGEGGTIAGYVYLKNRLFINAYLIKAGLGSPDLSREHQYRKKFMQLQEQRDQKNPLMPILPLPARK